MAFPLYPQLEVVQTRSRKDDWVVSGTFDGEKDYGPELIPVAPGSAWEEERLSLQKATPGV